MRHLYYGRNDAARNGAATRREPQEVRRRKERRRGACAEVAAGMAMRARRGAAQAPAV